MLAGLAPRPILLCGWGMLSSQRAITAQAHSGHIRCICTAVGHLNTRGGEPAAPAGPSAWLPCAPFSHPTAALGRLPAMQMAASSAATGEKGEAEGLLGSRITIGGTGRQRRHDCQQAAGE